MSEPAAAEPPRSELVPCPDPACGMPAEIVSRWTWSSPDGPLEHVRTRCVLGHVFTPLLSYVAALQAAEAA